LNIGSLALRTILCVAVFASLCHAGDGLSEKLNSYLYEDTKRLVALVEDAAEMMEQRGTDAFKEFGEKDSRWFTNERYLFVYDIEGRCLFHPITPELVGKNLIGFKDMQGKPVISLITEVGKKLQRDASGWVFYLWSEASEWTPSWKSSYVRKVVGPDKRIYVIGSGSYNIKIERVFVQENVDRAAQLLQEKGRKVAFATFKDAGSSFHLLGTYIFVIDQNGRALLDPSLPIITDRDLAEFRDAVGRYPMREVVRKLRQSNEAWVQYLWPKPGSALPSRKLIYIRKVKVDNEAFIVGSDFFMATPIWMRQ
jgi:signal transduction histidine kinase